MIFGFTVTDSSCSIFWLRFLNARLFIKHQNENNERAPFILLHYEHFEQFRDGWENESTKSEIAARAYKSVHHSKWQCNRIQWIFYLITPNKQIYLIFHACNRNNLMCTMYTPSKLGACSTLRNFELSIHPLFMFVHTKLEFFLLSQSHFQIYCRFACWNLWFVVSSTFFCELSTFLFNQFPSLFVASPT